MQITRTTMSKKSDAPSKRSQVKRGHIRADYKQETIHKILDAMPLCHVSYVLDGSPVVTPTFQWRQGNRVYWHGSSASRMMRKAQGAEVCLAVTILDGMVLARSAFHHSVNYRSVMLFGTAQIVDDREEATQSLKAMIEGLYPGRWDMLRAMNEQELKATTVLSMPIDEAAAKVRTGPPIDDEEDYGLPIWAGVLPITMQVGAPFSDPRVMDGVKVPAHAKTFKIGKHDA